MADRTVSVRLRAQIGDFVAEMRIAGAAVDDFDKKVDGAGRKTQDSFKKTDESVSKSSQSVRAASVSSAGWIASLVGAAVGIAPPFIAAGAAAGAFAAVAAPSIVKVVTAQKDLNAGWSTLDSRQKVASAHLTGVIGQYKSLAKAYEPAALATFNGLLGDTSVLMQRSKPLMDAGARGISGFRSQVDSFVTGGTMQRFLNFATVNAEPAFAQLGQTFTQTGNLALNLGRDLGPMGMTLLSSANSGLRFLNTIEQVNPHLAEAALTAVALKAPTQALGNLWTNNASKLGKLAKEGSAAEGFLSKLGKTVGSSPNLYIGAALAAGYVAARLSTMKDNTEKLIDSVRTENQAFGNNTAGHLAAAKSLGTYITQERAATKAAVQGTVDIRDRQRITTVYNGELKKLTDARKQELTAANNVQAGEKDLSQQYGITAKQANQLATAAGVDLSKGITGSGDAAQAAQAKIRAYRQAVLDAQDKTKLIDQALTAAGNSTLALKDRMTALTNAFGALAGPELQAYDATTKTAGAFDQFDAAMKKSKGSMSLTTVAGQNARAAFAGLLSTIEQNIDAQYAYDSATKGAAVAARNRAATARQLLPVLLAEAGGNKQATRAILDWANAAGVGKTRAQAMSSALGLSRSAFLRAAEGAGKTRAEALRLWAAFNKLPAVKNTKLNSNAVQRRKEVQDYQAKLDALHGKTVTISDNAAAARARIDAVQSALSRLQNKSITITTYYRQIDIANRTGNAERGSARGDNTGATGGLYTGRHFRYGAGGEVSGYVTGPGTGTSDDIRAPWLSNGEYVINAKQTAKHRALLDMVNKGSNGFAAGGLVGYATGGTVTGADVNFSDLLSQWTDMVKPSSASDVSSAIKDRKTQIDQLKNAQAALRKAEEMAKKTHKERLKRAEAIAAAERRIKKERQDVTDATKKLADVEARRKYALMSPASQLSSALGMSIKGTGAFIRNLTALSDRGFGFLANQLLAQGGPEAEKIAADAVKMSNKRVSGLQGQAWQAQQQQAQLANLPAALTTRSAVKAGKGKSWVGLLTATGLTPDVLAVAVRSMLTDLNKTAAGRSLVADMHAHGYARGGEITGVPGVDRNLIRATKGEYMINDRSTAKYRPWVEAINSDRLSEFVRHMVSGGSGGRAPAGGGGSAAAAPVFHQTFPTQEMDKAELARNVARETAWALK